MAAGTDRKAEISRVPCHSWYEMNCDSIGHSLAKPQLTTSGISQDWTSGRAYRKAEPFGAHSHLWQAPIYRSAPTSTTLSGIWLGAWAPSMMVRMPAARARRQMACTGKISAVELVMWLMKITLVRSVTPAQK